MSDHVNTGKVKRAAELITAALFFLLTDQFTKYLVVRHLKGNPPIILINGILEFLYVENTGAAFGILKGRAPFFFVITAVVVILILFYYMRIPDSRRFFPLRLIAWLLTGGALGNLTDRLLRSYVVDFIYFKPIDFPVFNVADIYVTCSAAGLILLFLFFYRDDELDGIFAGAGQKKHGAAGDSGKPDDQENPENADFSERPEESGE